MSESSGNFGLNIVAAAYILPWHLAALIVLFTSTVQVYTVYGPFGAFLWFCSLGPIYSEIMGMLWPLWLLGVISP